MSWINKLLSASEQAETPVEWIYWSGIATISAVVSPNVYINRGGIYKLSPNVFIMLIGESGLGKGFPITISKVLVNMTKVTRVISGSNTIAAILQNLGNTETDEKTGVPKFKDSRGYIVSGEFSTLFQEDKRSLPIITELYDTHYSQDWTNSTKNSGVDKLNNVCITLFGGSTPEHFAAVVPEADVKGGFVGRILTVYQEARSKVNPLDDTDADNDFPFKQLAEYLKEISLIQGPFKFTSESRQYWRDWYNAIRPKKVHDPTGAVNRLPDNVLKVAMCIALSRGPDRIIETCDLEESIEKCMQLTIDSRRLTDGKGRSASGENTKLVMMALYSHPEHSLYKGKLLEIHYGHFDVYELDRIIQTLETAEIIESTLVNGRVKLTMLPAAVNSLGKLAERL
jgi:Protein of unknown function (DUF3987)